MRHLAGLLAVLTLVVVGLWIQFMGAGEVPRAAAPAIRPTASSSSSQTTALQTRSSDPAAKIAVDEKPTRKSALPVAESPGKPRAEEVESVHPVVIHCARGDRRKLAPGAIEIVLTRVSDGKRVVISSTGSNTLEGEISYGFWKLQAHSPGFRHVAAVHDFSDYTRLRATPVSQWDLSRSFVGYVHFWPADWIPVVVRTPNGQPIVKLARDQGLGSRRDLVNAISIQTSYYEMIGGLGAPGMENGPLCRLHSTQGWGKVELPGGVIGSLEILQPRPFWVTVLLFDSFLDRQLLQASAGELVIHLDGDSFRRMRSEVWFRVVQRGTRATVSGASVTLRADISTHTNSDLQRMESDPSGLVHFESVMPGKYDLLINWEDQLALRKLEVQSGVVHELGEIMIGAGPGVLIRVVDGNGIPARSVIDVAAYEPDGHVADLYELDRGRMTDDAGTYHLELPTVPSIVRARPLYLRGPERDFETIGTRNVLIDPDDPPTEIVLVAKLPVEVVFDTSTARIPWEDGQHLDVMARWRGSRESLVVHRVLNPSARVLMLPGEYNLRRWDGGQEILFQGAAARVETESRTISLR